MFTIPSSLTFANANSVLDEGLRAIDAGQAMFDFAPLAAADSAAVAILLAWRRAAAGRNSALQFQNLSANLQSLAGLYGVADLLAAEKSDASSSTSNGSPHH